MTMLMQDQRSENVSIAEERLTFPCSSSQLRCWFVNAVNPGTPALNIALRWELKGRFDPSTIERAFNVIVQRHEMLRTRIVESDGTPQQDVLASAELTLSEIDLTHVPAAERTTEALKQGRAEARRAFVLSEAPLLRITLLSLAPEHAFLLVTVHQVAFDGWSIRLLSHEFATISASLTTGTRRDLPDLPVQYGDYAAWQQAFLDSVSFETERNYWRARLADAPYFEVPPDRERPRRPTSNCEIIATHVPREVSEGMLRAIKQHQVTLFGFGCGVIATALHHYTGSDEVIFGTQISGRDDPDLDPIIGVFINNLVLRFDMRGDDPFAERLEAINKTVQDALVHQRMPFHTLVRLLKPPRDPRRMPLLSVNLTVLQDVMDDESCGTFDLMGQPSLSTGSLYDLNFFLVHWPATGWRMALEYNTDLFEPTTAAQLLDLWADVLRVAVETPRFRISELRACRRDAVRPQAVSPEAAIETALQRHPAVARAAVGRRERPDGTVALQAFVVPAQTYAGTLDTVSPMLLAHIAGLRPELASLDGVSLLMDLPTTSDGRPDRSQLTAWWPETGRALPRGAAASREASSSGEVVTTLSGIWAEILGVPSVDPRADFFDLGGHSLLAMRMLARAERAFGLKLRLSDLLLNPNVEGLAACITGCPPGCGHPEMIRTSMENASKSAADMPGAVAQSPDIASDDWRLVKVRDPGADTAIFGINSVKELHEFWEETGGDRGLFSVQMFEPGRPHGLGDMTFEEIASSYLALIRRAQPRGPYRLFGLCVHGVLAYEIAQQMRRAGDEVELLAFKSAWHPTYFQRLSLFNRWVVRLSQVRDNFEQVRKGRKTIVEFLANYSAVQRSGVLSLAVKLGVLRKVPPRTGSQFNDEALLALMAARDAYDPKSYDGRVLQYVGPDAPRGKGFDPTLGWSGVIVGPLTIRDMETGAERVWEVGREHSGPAAERVFNRSMASQSPAS